MATAVVRRALSVTLAGLMLLVPAAILNSSFKQPTRLNALDRIVLTASSPVQGMVTWVIDGVGGIWSRYVWLVDVGQENRELVRENERLTRELADAKRAAADAGRLEQALELRDRVPAETMGARVIAMGMSPSFRVLRITLDRGDDRVKPGMPVVAPEGAVGRIQRVYHGHADVQLAVDAASSIDVVIPRTGSRGVLKGAGGDNAYACKIGYLMRGEEVKEGDLVVTSGLGGAFPRDVPIGRIRSIKKVDYEMYQEVVVEPAVDFSRLSHVLIVLAPPPPPDPEAKTKTATPAFGVTPYR